MGWSTSWNLPPIINWIEEAAKVPDKAWDDLKAGIAVTKVSLDKADTFKIEHVEHAKAFLNNKPTHDPYKNPNAHIYYECGCGAILDPGTASFASLNNHASNVGWKIRFGERGYTPYCVKCGKNVE